MASAELTRTLYRALLRGSTRVRSAMRPGHVVIVAQVVQRFAEHAQVAPSLLHALREHGPLPLPGLVRHAFRQPSTSNEDHVRGVDTAFSALRSISSIESFVIQNNQLFDSLKDISDREAPELPQTRYVASAILRDASLPSQQSKP